MYNLFADFATCVGFTVVAIPYFSATELSRSAYRNKMQVSYCRQIFISIIYLVLLYLYLIYLKYIKYLLSYYIAIIIYY